MAYLYIRSKNIGDLSIFMQHYEGWNLSGWHLENAPIVYGEYPELSESEDSEDCFIEERQHSLEALDAIYVLGVLYNAKRKLGIPIPPMEYYNDAKMVNLLDYEGDDDLTNEEYSARFMNTMNKIDEASAHVRNPRRLFHYPRCVLPLLH